MGIQLALKKSEKCQNFHSITMNLFHYLISFSLTISVESKRIVNGVEVDDPEKFPFFASIYLQNPDLISTIVCGGSLIHPEWILTAAHCFPEDNTTYEWVANQTGSLVSMGSVDKSVDKFRQNRSIESIIPHPDYRYEEIHLPQGGTSYLMFYDIGLITVQTPFVLTPTVKVIHLSTRFLECPTGLVLGYGRTIDSDPSSLSKKLKYARLRLVEYNKLCLSLAHPTNTSIFAESEVYVHEDYGYFSRGDSGGPFICDNVTPVTQIGVISKATPPCKSGIIVSVLERVDHSIGFITEYVRIKEYKEKSRKYNSFSSEQRKGSGAKRIEVFSILLTLIVVH